MEHNSTTFFCEKGEGPKVALRYTKPDPEDSWPITLSIYHLNRNCPEITIHLADELNLIKFKSSVLEAYNSYRKDRGYGK